MDYKNYLQSNHWKKLRSEKLADCDHCQICDSRESLVVHHKRYWIGEKEARLSGKRLSIPIDPGSLLGREMKKDLMILCSSCHRLWHYYFKNRYLTHKKASQVRRLIFLGVKRDQAFMVTKTNVLYNPVFIQAKDRESLDSRSLH